MGEQAHIVIFRKLLPLFACAGAGDGGIVFGSLIAVVGVEHGLDIVHIAPLFVGNTTDILSGAVGFVGGEACHVGDPLLGEAFSFIANHRNSTDGLYQVLGISLEQFCRYRAVVCKNSGEQFLFLGFGEGERAFNGS